MGDLSSGGNFPVVEGGNHSNGGFGDDEYLNSFPPGYRFKPLDHELIGYLAKKIFGQPLPPNKIRFVELYKYSPDQLAAMYEPVEENTWYFFTPRDRKYKNGWRPNRAAGNGYWKATTADKPIFSAVVPSLKIGTKKSLVYHTGKAPKGIKTNWIMHEYEVANAPKKISGRDDMRLDDCVLCRIHRKPDESSNAQAEELDKNNNNQLISDNEQIPTLSSKEEPLQPQPIGYPDDWVILNNNQPIFNDQQIRTLSSKEEHLQPQPTCCPDDSTNQNNNQPISDNQQIHTVSSKEEPLQPQPTWYPDEWVMLNNNNNNNGIASDLLPEEELQRPTWGDKYYGENGDFVTHQNEWFFTVEELLN